MPRITKRLVDAAEARSAEYFVWDTEIPGFGLRVLRSGRKGYVVQYRAGSRPRRISLGPSTVLTCEQARNRHLHRRRRAQRRGPRRRTTSPIRRTAASK